MSIFKSYDKYHFVQWLIFIEQLWQPMPVMIWIAAGTEAAISNWPDMGILLAIQFINASLGFYEITKAGNVKKMNLYNNNKKHFVLSVCKFFVT